MRYLILAAVLSLVVFSGCARKPAYPEAPVRDAVVSIDVSDVSTLRAGAPAFYSHGFEGRRINFFVIRLDGVISSFFDACETCYAKKLGYAFVEGSVLCRACGMTYTLAEIEKGEGKCHPVKLSGRLEGGKYLIPLESIRSRADMF